jgi:hypothetical protein
LGIAANAVVIAGGSARSLAIASAFTKAVLAQKAEIEAATWNPSGERLGELMDFNLLCPTVDHGCNGNGREFFGNGEKEMATGVVKKFIEDRGFGFITPDGSRTDVFSTNLRCTAPPCRMSARPLSSWKRWDRTAGCGR